MDVKINSRLIKLEREKRAWTQEHLAKASGLAPRTIQRIEKTGVGSFESVRALAAVFDLSVADLRVDSASARPQDGAIARSFSGLSLRLLLVGLGGLLFGAGVLWPYLRLAAADAWRAIALIAASALSYFCAMWTVLIVPPDWLGATRPDSPQSLVLASAVGACIVLTAAKFLAPLRTNGNVYFVLGAVASVLGGLGMYAAGAMFDDTFGAVSGFASWHVAMCLALHFGSEPKSAGLRIAQLLGSRGPTSRTPPSELLQAAYFESPAA